MRWKKGTLFAGTLDIERCLFNLYRKGVPMEALKLKADEYVAAGLLTLDMARHVCKAIEDERGHTTVVNEQAEASAENGTEGGSVSSRLSAAALKKELEVREKNMQAGAEDGGVTDQWRVYQHVIHQLQSGEPIRLMVQAGAGGKWVIAKGFKDFEDMFKILRPVCSKFFDSLCSMAPF